MTEITPIIKSRLPSFLEKLYPQFTDFITAYFEQLESDGQVINEITRFINNTDSTIENAKYWDKILADISWGLKEEFTVDKRLFILFVRHYYMSRGTAKSVEFLFKLFYNDHPKITYPRDKLLMLSNTEYRNTVTMYLKNNVEANILRRMQELSQNFGLVGRGVTSGGSLIVDNVDIMNGYIRLFISTSNDFLPHETIELTGENFQHIFENVPVYSIDPISSNEPISEFNFTVNNIPFAITLLNLGKVIGVQIADGGLDYRVGDYFTDVEGVGIYGEVIEVDNKGTITRVQLTSTGIDTAKVPEIHLYTSTGRRAILNAIVDDKVGRPLKVVNHAPIFEEFTHNNITFKFTKKAFYESPKRWLNDNHIVESNAILLDSYYWHQFAYQIESGIARPEYEHFVKENEHPPGYSFFSQLDLEIKDAIVNTFKTGRDMINKSFLGFLFASVISNLSQRQYTTWQPNLNYIMGDLVSYNDNIYIATSNGTSGHLAPKHTKDRANDGGVQWQFVQSINKDLKSVSNIYLALSQGDNPINDAFYAKRIPHTSIRLGIRYQPLLINSIAESGKIYKTDDNKVFYCVKGGTVTVQPLEANSNTMNVDGTVWRYVGTINSNDSEYITGEYIPIQIADKPIIRNELIDATLLGQVGSFESTDDITYSKVSNVGLDYSLTPEGQITGLYVASPGYSNSNLTLTLHHKEASGSGAVVRVEHQLGQITSLVVENNGIGYVNGASVIIVGNGTGAEATVQTDSLGAVTGITITNAGSGYTEVKAYIVPGDKGAIVQLNKIDISPASFLHSLEPDVMLFNVTIDDVAGYIDHNARYDSLSIISNANKDQHLHIGNGVHKIDKTNSVLLWNQKITPKQRSEGQKEKILIAITME